METVDHVYRDGSFGEVVVQQSKISLQLRGCLYSNDDESNCPTISPVILFPGLHQAELDGKCFLEFFVSSPRDVLKEMLSRYESSVQLQKEELEAFREKAVAYVRYLESEIAENLETMEIIKRQLEKSPPAARNPLSPTIFPQPRAVRTPDQRGEGGAGVQKSQSDVIRSVAAAILREERRPLKQAELKQLMDARGIEIRSGDPVDLIRAALRRAPEFKHIPRVGYILSET
ncbi:hypothetical protein CYG48_13340 [Neorhizobium sp. SOG26]|uniref:hypothetical protein n=1 Tax=Neorhizobium sp. SOG26 TaxID=2060726 RepID=UPI000E56E497|nr:hypothetical protein [Neorhizobium sp. SOG26]AXV16585.1 hypothetical protein CYG48_13340 [Neorhizobium sp. SOG26]